MRAPLTSIYRIAGSISVIKIVGCSVERGSREVLYPRIHLLLEETLRVVEQVADLRPDDTHALISAAVVLSPQLLVEREVLMTRNVSCIWQGTRPARWICAALYYITC